MRVLCVENGAFVARGPERLLNRHSARFHVELSERLPGLVVAQALMPEGEPTDLADLDLASFPGLKVDTRPAPGPGALARIGFYLRAIPWAYSAVGRCDHLYVFLPGHLSLLFAAMARIRRRPYGAYLRGATGMDGRLLRWALRHAAFVFATGDALRDRARTFGASAETVVPMVEIEVADIEEKIRFREEGPFRLLFVGRVDQAKGVRELVTGVRRLVEAGRAVELDVLGSGDDLETCRGLAEGLPGVRFRGVVSDRSELAGFFRGADLFVLPTHAEGFPRVLYEAMAYGTPIATTFVGGIPSVMVEDENCLRLEVKNPERLADTLESALGSPRLRRRLSEAGTTTIRRLLGEWKQSHADQVAEKIEATAGQPAQLS